LRKPFYGWIIVAVSFLIGFTESGVFQNILSIFMKPMVEEFGWTRASVTGAIAFGSVCGGLLSLVVGPILDRHGPRMVSFWGIFILSVGLGAMTFVTHIWQLYLFFGVGRMIAVGALSLATAVSISNWFFRFRGRAMGIMKIGERFGSALLPMLVQFVILSLGWRLAWGTLGVVVFLISGIPALLFLRHRPEDMGLLPDGALPATDVRGTADPSIQEKPDTVSDNDSEPVWTRPQAARTKVFWVLTFLSSLIPFGQAGINFHLYPFLTDQGLSETTAVLIIGTFAVFGMAGSAIWGTLTERFRIQNLLALNVIGNGLIFLVLYWVVQFKIGGASGTGIIFPLAALHGIFHGGRNPMLPVMWAAFFGRRSLGSIYGLANPFCFAANAMGPIFAGLCFDLLGNYSFPFYFFVAVFVVSGMISLYVRPPRYSAAAG
jgi:MFS family permease